MDEGQVFWRGDDGYERERCAAVWNELKPDRYPAGIVLARSDQDVVDAVLLARARGLKVKARAGGHSWTASSVRNGSLLVNLAELDDVTIDPAAGTAVVGAGAKGRNLNRLLEPHGLFFPTGHCGTVGLGGFLLQGGWGWNSTKLGPACQSLIGVDVVTADGELIHADETTNSDLLWAARGAGPGFFGIVTRFYVRCHPRPASMMVSGYVYPMDALDEILTWAIDVGRALPPEVEFVVLGTTPRDGSVVVDGPAQVIVSGIAMFDDDEQSREALSVLETCPVLERALGSETYAPKPLDDLYELGDSTEPAGFRWAVDSMWTDADADVLVPAIRELFHTLPTPASHVFWMHWREQEIPGSALSVTGQVYIGAFSGWTDPPDDARLRFWGRDHMRRLEPLSKGIQLADENLDGRPEARYLSDENRERLEALRTQWDPDGVFLSYLAGEG